MINELRVSAIRQQLNIQLYKNSLFIIMNKLLVAGTGFVFWLLAARYYSVGDIGLAVALISSSTLIVQFSSFGFDYSLIRFQLAYDRSRIFNTSFIISVASSFTIGLLYVLLVNHFSPSLSFIQVPIYAGVFMLLVILTMAAQITGVSFVAQRRAEFNLVQNVALTSRVLLLIPLAFLGELGILSSLVIAYLLVAVIVFYLLGRFIRYSPKVDREYIKKSFSFSSGNYVAGLLFQATYQLLPLLVLNICGEVDAGKFFIAFTIGNFLLQIPEGVGISLFVEGSHGEAMRANVIRAGTAIYALLIPGVVFVYFFGSSLLTLFGKGYAESIELLRLIAFSSFLFAVYSLMVPVLNVKMKVRSVVSINAILFVLFMILAYTFISRFGIIGVGYTFLLTYLILDIIIIGFARLEKLI